MIAPLEWRAPSKDHERARGPRSQTKKKTGIARLFRVIVFVRSALVEEAAQHAAAARVLELAQRLGLDLANALAGHRELLADFFQRVVGVHADAEAHAQHALLARRQRRQHPRRALAQIALDGGLERDHRVLVLDEVAEMRILLVADRRLE